MSNQGQDYVTWPTTFHGRSRSRRGDDVRAERGLRVGRDQTTIRSVLGVHVVDFPLLSPVREN